MLPVVAVEIAAADVPVFEAEMLDACNEGLKRARCSAAAEHTDPVWAVAVVSWRSDQEVLIEVGREQPGSPAWVSRTLHFESADSLRERWRAVGFTTALLVGEEPEPPLAAIPLKEVVTLGARLLWGTGLEGGAFRTGAEIRLDVAPWASPWFLSGALQYALAREDAVDLDVRWLALSAGVGWALAAGENFLAQARAELLAENLAAASDRGGSRDRSDLWVPGVRGAFDLLWPASGTWAVLASGEVFWLEVSTPIAREGVRIAKVSGAGVLLLFGAEYRF